MTDSGPLPTRVPRHGAAAQFGIFATVLSADAELLRPISFTLPQAAAIGIIGGADGPDGEPTCRANWRWSVGATAVAAVIVYGAGAVNPAADYAR